MASFSMSLIFCETLLIPSEFTRVVSKNIHLSQHWIYDILLRGRLVITNLLQKMQGPLKEAMQHSHTHTGLYLYVWLCV